MASSFIQGSLAISRDETSGNNLDVDQLNVIDPGASMETRTVQVRDAIYLLSINDVKQY